MKEISNMFLPNNEILSNLKDYISSKSKITTWVGRNKVDNQNPMVVFREARNELNSQSTTYDNTSRIMNYDIKIYCHTLPNSYSIVSELVLLVTEVMQGYYHMSGGLVAEIMNYKQNEATGFMANLRFTTRFIPSRNKLY